MSESYSPDPGAVPESSYATAFLSQRDLGLRIPINYVTSPGVSFTAACSPYLRYEDDNSGDCLSNLLAVGFRRFEIDLYWDEERLVWSFCPVALPKSINPEDELLPATTPSLSSSTLPALTSNAAPTISPALMHLQATDTVSNSLEASSSPVSSSVPASSSPSALAESSSTLASSLGNDSPPYSIIPDSPNEPLVSVGPYVCTTTINLSTFISQFLDYIDKTENTLEAQLLYVFLNIHAAASYNSPTSSAPTPSSLPDPPNLLGTLFSANLSAYQYTPTNLKSDRANLNSSWYTVSEMYRPVRDYYLTNKNEYNIISTEDGWPSESYVEFSKGKRLLLGWGSVDPQMAGYNFSGDSGTIFPNGYIQDFQTNLGATISGQLTKGCFVRNNTDDLSKANSSWAANTNIAEFTYPTASSSNIIPLLNLTLNTTNCGISSILNVTLLNATAKDNYHPYQNYSYSTIWSWAPGEPRNYTSSDAGSDSVFRCASMSSALGGRWAVTDCSQRYYAACRARGQPYNWTITTYPIAYSYADSACPNAYTFAAPRTGLENSYLNQAMRTNRRDYDGHSLWVDFNSLDYDNCWVMGGPNATCPYKDSLAQLDDLKKRVILVPTIAALIVLVITALTVFVKAAGNKKTRKVSKKRNRKAADNGFLYEGVPS